MYSIIVFNCLSQIFYISSNTNSERNFYKIEKNLILSFCMPTVPIRNENLKTHVHENESKDVIGCIPNNVDRFL